MCSLRPRIPERFGLSSLDSPSSSHIDSFFPLLPSSHQSLEWKEKVDFHDSSLVENNTNNSHNNSISNSNSNNNDNDRGKCENAVEVKKLSHKASERDRRKKLNALYSSLRSLLPAADQTKKQSIPATLSRVLKYIPEQRQEVERLCRRKEDSMKRILRQNGDSNRQEKQKERLITGTLLPRIVVTQLTETEIAVQISAAKRTTISGILLCLEENGLQVLSASSSVSSRTRFFHSLHLEISRDCKVKFGELSDMILSVYEKKDQRHPTKQNIFS